MIKMSRNNVVIIFFFVLFIFYFIWSQFALYEHRASLKNAEKKIYNIADNLEFWKLMSIRQGIQFDVDYLGNDVRNIKITPIKNNDGLPLKNEDNQFYILSYSGADKKRKKELERYFSDLVLQNYFYVVTDRNGKIKEMFWDKP